MTNQIHIDLDKWNMLTKYYGGFNDVKILKGE